MVGRKIKNRSCIVGKDAISLDSQIRFGCDMVMTIVSRMVMEPCHSELLPVEELSTMAATIVAVWWWLIHLEPLFSSLSALDRRFGGAVRQEKQIVRALGMGEWMEQSGGNIVDGSDEWMGR